VGALQGNESGSDEDDMTSEGFAGKSKRVLANRQSAHRSRLRKLQYIQVRWTVSLLWTPLLTLMNWRGGGWGALLFKKEYRSTMALLARATVCWPIGRAPTAPAYAYCSTSRYTFVFFINMIFVCGDGGGGGGGVFHLQRTFPLAQAAEL